MSVGIEFEERLRRGLEDNARAMPPAPAAWAPLVREVVPPGRNRRGARPVRAVAAVVILVLAGAVVVVSRRMPVVVTPATERESPGTTAAPVAALRPGTGHVPGRAVVVGHNQLVTFDATGQETGSQSLDPLKDVMAVSSDLDGGWLACGRLSDATPTMEILENPPDEFRPKLFWYRPGREPVMVSTVRKPCLAGSITVVDSPQGPTMVYPEVLAPTPRLRALVLATGDDRLVIDGATDPALQKGMFASWTAAPGRILIHAGAPGGLRQYDLATGASLPLPDISPNFPTVPVLAPDGSSLAVIGTPGRIWEPAELVVYDLTTGAVRHREPLNMLNDYHAQLSYDGTTVAVGSDDPASPNPVTVLDLSTGARHTIDVHGRLV